MVSGHDKGDGPMESMNLFHYDSPIGRLICTFDESVLIDLSIGSSSSKGQGDKRKGSPPLAVRAFFRDLDAYFQGEPVRFARSLYRMEGTDFEKTVWEALLAVPYGQARTYKWLAERIGKPGAARAVGQALGRNPLLIVVPCHRIIASDGSLGGFSCGIEVKKWLLKHERKTMVSNRGIG